jgi:plastocyanin
MRQTLLIVIILFLLSLGFYFFYGRGEKTPQLTYEEPKTFFFDAKEISPNDKVIEITRLSFEPQSITIKRGEKVTWVSKTESLVWPASNPHPTHGDYSAFDPELPMGAGKAWSFVFEKVGTWPYHDHLDPMKRGVIYVEEL